MKFEHYTPVMRESYLAALLDIGARSNFEGDLKLLIFAKSYQFLFRWESPNGVTPSPGLDRFNEVDQWVSCNVQRTFDTYTIRTRQQLVVARWYGFRGEDDAFGFKMQWC